MGILSVKISKKVQFEAHLEYKVKLPSKKLDIQRRAKLHFTMRRLLDLYKTQVRPYVEDTSRRVRPIINSTHSTLCKDLLTNLTD